MGTIYQHVSGGGEQVIGRVDSENGSVYSARFGAEKYVGRVDYAQGYVYSHRGGPDKNIGWVDVENGKIYDSQFGDDHYMGQVDADGKLYQHVPLLPDIELGYVDDLHNVVEGAAALLLLFADEATIEQEDQVTSNDLPGLSLNPGLAGAAA